VDPYPLLAEGSERLEDHARECAVLEAWHRERPLDTGVWDKLLQGLERAGRTADLIALLEEILVLARYFLPPDQIETVRTLLAARRG
jgi:DNA-binding SARP family transcriptional activator